MPHITIFLKNGSTLRFEDTSQKGETTQIITFDYTSASDGLKKKAVFYSDSIAGIGEFTGD